MFDIHGALEHQMLEVMKNRPTVVLTESREPRLIEAACYLTRYARLVFLAPEDEVRAVAAEHLEHVDATRLAYTFEEATFVDPSTADDLLDEFANECISLPPEKRETSDFDQARERLKQPSRFGVMSVRLGHADMVVGGMIHEPRNYSAPC